MMLSAAMLLCSARIASIVGAYRRGEEKGYRPLQHTINEQWPAEKQPNAQQKETDERFD